MVGWLIRLGGWYVMKDLYSIESIRFILVEFVILKKEVGASPSLV